MRRIFAGLILLLLLLPTSAQEDIPLTEYLRAVNAAFDIVENSHSFDGAMLRLLVEKELVQRNSSTPDVSAVPLDILTEANSHIEGMYISLDAYGWWHGLVVVWLDSAPEPQRIETGYREEIDSEIELYDFEADGIPEMLVHGVGTVEGHIGARWDGESWREFDVPLLQDIPASHSYALVTSLVELGFDDINRDGLPEWRVITANAGGCQGCFLEVGQLDILGWRDGALVQLVPHVGYTTGTDGVTWEFSDDGFVLRQDFRDSWGCEWHGAQRYGWDGDTRSYTFVSESLDYEESFECALRVAEKANWSGELESAAVLYELAITRMPDDPARVNSEVYQYARLRLAIVYTLTGQHDNAALLIGALAEMTPQSQFVADMLAAIRMNVPDPYRTCAAVHNLFTRDYAAFSSRINGSIPTEMTIGYVLDDIFPNSFYRPLPTPDKAGCDVERLIAKDIGDGIFFAQTTPRAVFESYGLGVSDERMGDIDGDGVQDFVVWLTADVPAFVIYSQRFNASGLPLLERVDIPRTEAGAPLLLPTTPTPGPSRVSHADPDSFPCYEEATCDMLDPKTVYVLMEQATGLTYAYGGGYELPPAEPRLRRALELAIEQHSPAEYPLRYLWGLMLEAGGDAETARAEFAAIIDNAPDSPWAVLAVLHVN